MKVTRQGLVAVGLALTLGGCKGRREEETATTTAAPPAAQPAETTGAMPGMKGMPGMPGMRGDSMMATMQSYMQMMEGMNAESMKAMLPQHRQMVANMLAHVNQQMRQMSMPGDAAWNATVDSVRQDLTRMPEMSASELRAFMPAHGQRVMRLVEMHRTMMGQSR